MHTEQMTQWIQKNLSQERFEHSLGVADLAVELAARYGEDTGKAKTAGLLHDCAKELGKEESRALLGRIDGLDELVLSCRPLWHGPAGAEYAKEHFQIDDEIYDAVFYHTIGKRNMPLLTKIIFLADAAEINRDKEFPWSGEIRKLAFKDLDAAVMQVIDCTLVSVIERGLTIHPNSVLIRNDIIRERNRRIVNG